MKTKHYCYRCGSPDISRMHRWVLVKKLFRTSPKFKCNDCQATLTVTRINHNKLIEYSWDKSNNT